MRTFTLLLLTFSTQVLVLVAVPVIALLLGLAEPLSRMKFNLKAVAWINLWTNHLIKSSKLIYKSYLCYGLFNC